MSVNTQRESKCYWNIMVALFWKTTYTSLLLYTGIAPVQAHISRIHEGWSVFPAKKISKVQLYYNNSLYYPVLSMLLSMFSLIGTDHLLSKVLYVCLPIRWWSRLDKFEDRWFNVFVLPWILVYFLGFAMNIGLTVRIFFVYYNSDYTNAALVVASMLMWSGLNVLELWLHWRVQSIFRKITNQNGIITVYYEF